MTIGSMHWGRLCKSVSSRQYLIGGSKSLKGIVHSSVRLFLDYRIKRRGVAEPERNGLHLSKRTLKNFITSNKW